MTTTLTASPDVYRMLIADRWTRRDGWLYVRTTFGCRVTLRTLRAGRYART